MPGVVQSQLLGTGGSKARALDPQAGGLIYQDNRHISCAAGWGH